MAKVLVSIKAYPEGVETDRKQLVEKIRATLPKGYELIRFSEEPVAFGYTLLKLYITMPEETEGGTEKLEELLRGVEGIEDIEIETVHRLSEF